MKNFVVRFAFAAALVVSASTLHAQAADVTGGSFSLTLDPTFVTLLQGQGVTPSVFGTEGTTKISFIPAVIGTFDLTSGLGTVSGFGQMVFQTSAGVLRIHALQFENLGTVPVLTGAYYLNGHYMGRNAVLNVSIANPVKAPIQNQLIMATSIPTTVAPYLSMMLVNSFNVTVPTTASSGMLGLNVGLSTLN